MVVVGLCAVWYGVRCVQCVCARVAEVALRSVMRVAASAILFDQ